jgi:hypothetical protein
VGRCAARWTQRRGGRLRDAAVEARGISPRAAAAEANTNHVPIVLAVACLDGAEDGIALSIRFAIGFDRFDDTEDEIAGVAARVGALARVWAAASSAAIGTRGLRVASPLEGQDRGRRYVVL